MEGMRGNRNEGKRWIQPFCVINRPMDGRTDGRTDMTSYVYLRKHEKRIILKCFRLKLSCIFFSGTTNFSNRQQKLGNLDLTKQDFAKKKGWKLSFFTHS